MKKKVAVSGRVSGHKTAARLKAALDIAAMGAMEMGVHPHPTHREIIQADKEMLLAEYALIRRKKSKLSARQRRQVIYQVEKRGLL